MAKMTKTQLIDAIAEGTQLSKNDVKAVIEQMATVGYKDSTNPASRDSRFRQNVCREQAGDRSP